MSRRQVTLLAVAALFVASGCTGVLGPGTVESTFDDGADGWTVTGDAQSESTAPTHVAEGGNDGGYVSADDDVSGGIWYWNASDPYLGDRSAYVGGSLSFDLNQSATDSQFDAPDVVLASNETEIRYAFDEHPGTEWTNYEIPLDAAEWRHADSNATVTDEEFAAVLSALDRLWIRGEYRSGSDTGGLDTVVMRPS